MEFAKHEAPSNSLDDQEREINLIPIDLLEYWPSMMEPAEF